ncbi:hypothetical protein [Bradyrhizobium sp. 170]|uniref:hypothetical protein n=1 Tax=Bradyrhizobium sp. 170 TaxID=2782641 RepID=UPI001FFF8556|nr:hypothetical protein [Bradyrhizobium sp. 170]
MTITRKNALFAGSHGGRTWATIATLLQINEDERRRPALSAHADSRTDRAALTDLSDRRSHALELPSLNGQNFALTPLPTRLWYSSAAAPRSIKVLESGGRSPSCEDLPHRETGMKANQARRDSDGGLKST